MVDNTFLSPARQTPITFGADFVIHSTTKSLNGHSDVVGGVVVSRRQEDADTMHWWANCAGVTGAPFDSYMTLRGLRTLHARMDIAESNATAIADWLSEHSAVTQLYFPGRNANADLLRSQQSGPGAVLAFELVPGGAKAVLENTTLFQPAPSLGGVESLICHPASMTHKGMEPEARRRSGLGDDLLRISAGIEATADLIADLDQAFAYIP
jgi:cystathionine gamma-synthase